MAAEEKTRTSGGRREGLTLERPALTGAQSKGVVKIQIMHTMIILHSRHHVKKGKKKKGKERESSKKGSRLKVQSIMELAELVKSGQVRVPKSLMHYHQDRVQLFDQVFTILSPEDVKQMIPNILKVQHVTRKRIFFKI